MEKIRWCLKAKKGIELVDPNDNLSKVYLKKSEDALRAAASLENIKDWQISSSYYAMYFALYSILMKIGIKCENHACTIEFMNNFLMGHFCKDDVKLLRNSMETRVDAQYYADRDVSEIKYKNMVREAPAFFAKCKSVLLKVNEGEISEIRAKLRLMGKAR